MSERSFFLPEAKAKVTEAIEEIELQTSAEVVVAVRRLSGVYRDTDYLVGFALAIGTLCFLLFSPTEFALWTMPIDLVISFALGVLLSANVDSVRRGLTGRKRLEENVHRAARAAFVDMGISRTSGRNGILVFVATFERRVEVVADIGVDPKALGQTWAQVNVSLAHSIRAALDFEGFLKALRALGPPLGAAMARAEDDVNELPDEVQ